jgi:hypothetical protein
MYNDFQKNNGKIKKVFYLLYNLKNIAFILILNKIIFVFKTNIL